LLGASATTLSAANSFPGAVALIPVTGTALLLMAGASSPPINRVLSNRHLVAIGDRSYSWYLWHWPCIVFAQALFPGSALAAPVGALFSWLPAAASYRFVEQPFRHWTPPNRQRLIAALGAVVLVPSLCATALFFGAQRGWGIDSVQETQAAATTGHVGFVECLKLANSETELPTWGPECTIKGTSSEPPIILVGDSNAAQYSEPLVEIGKATGRTVILRTAAACAFADVYRSTIAGWTPADQACRDYVTSTLQSLEDGPRSTVVMTMSASQWLLPARTIGLSQNDLSADPAVRHERLTQGVERVAQRLIDHGDQVVIVKPMMWLGESAQAPTVATCASMLEIVRGQCPRSIPRDEFADQTLPDPLSIVAKQLDIPIVDPVPLQCPDGICGSRTSQGQLVYMDSGHFSADFTQALTPEFLQAIAKR
jgi:hypothetical protein